MKIVGHRGARGLAPENTIAGLRKAIKHGVDEIEFDLRVTNDNVVVLHHDKKIKTPAGRKLRIRDHRYADLKEHDPDLATLKEVFSIKTKITLHIEIKPYEMIKPIMQAIEAELKAGRKPASLLIGSKSQKILVDMHRRFPAITKVVIEPWSGVRATWRAKQLDTRRLSMNKLWLWRGFIKPMTKRGWLLYAYTINDPAKAKRWANYGLTGIITDHPDRFES